MNQTVKVEQVTNPLEINKERLREWSACASGVRWFLEKFPQGGMFGDAYNGLRDDKRYQDSEWLIDHVFAELDAGAKTAQLVSIAGADKAKIEQQVKDCGGKEGDAATTGEHAVAAALGIEAKAKAGIGGAIVLCHRNDEGHLINVRASKVGENGIKPDVWYSLNKSGEFVETTKE